MRKVTCLAAALLVLVSLVLPAMAAQSTFVPSIGYKDGPEVEDAILNGEDVGDCIVVSSIKECQEKTTDIHQDDRDLLLDVYEQLRDGTMTLPLDDDYVIRELVDVSFREQKCVDPDHGHEEWLKQENTTIEITFDPGIPRNIEVVVLVFINGEWKPIEDVRINDDGSVICEFEDICPVVFCVDPDSGIDPPKTGDHMSTGLLLWCLILALSLAAMACLLKFRRRILR